MKKTTLYTAITAVVGLTANNAANAIDVDITQMDFNGSHVASKQLRDDVDDFGYMKSYDVFFDQHWAAVGVAYFEKGNATPIMDADIATDEAAIIADAPIETGGESGVPGENNTLTGKNNVETFPVTFGAFTQTATGDGTDFVWAGTAEQGAFSYAFTLADNQVAWGTLFNWNANDGIPVLNIMDCTDPANCAGIGTPMQTAPFLGNAPVFNGGLPPVSCVDYFTFIPSGSGTIDITESLTESCSNPRGALSLVSIGDPVSGSVANDGSILTYTPPSATFEGPDSFSFIATDGVNQATATYLVQVGGELQGNFTMMKGDGGTYGGANDVIFVWDQVTFNTDESDNNFDIIKISAETPFFGVKWNAHHIRVYDGGVSGKTLSFDTSCSVVQLEAGTSICGGGPMMELVIPPNMYGAHINFDWNGNENIDVVNVWEPNAKWLDDDGVGGKNDLYQGAQGVPADIKSTWELVSRDVNGDGINGSPMIDGPFPNNYANFSWKPDIPFVVTPDDSRITEVKAPSLSLNLWALFSGFMLLVGMRKVKNNK